jgi:hypothetical protein
MMGLFDMFKTQWSSGKMTPEDRKKLFWYLKRKTSYTAWRPAAEAFDAFAVVFKKQIVEEPVSKAVMSIENTDWERFYPEILRAQVLYEKGLAGILQGDRSVWLYNDRGILRDGWVLANSWYSELVNNGERGDHFYDGKYVDEMTDAISVFYRATRDAGYLQPRRAGTPAPEFWGEGMYCILNNEMFPLNPEPGERKLKLASLIEYPSPLPEVPVAEKEVVIKTGENIPVFGIYEPQVKDGCMNYLLQNTPAPTLAYERGSDQPVVWRLIWEDTRYLDGVIPDEEALYFPHEVETVKPTVISVSSDIQPSAPTGALCPQSGNWVVLDDIHGKQTFQKGERLPQHQGRDVTWLLVNN